RRCAESPQRAGGPRGQQGARREGGGRLMWLDRRAFTAGLLATLAAPRARAAGTVQDAGGRSIAVPDRVARVFPAGPPAAILLYTLSPDLPLGWPRANRADDGAVRLPPHCA